MLRQATNVNPLLIKQLADVGITSSTLPTLDQWNTLLATISGDYTTYQSTEIDLQQSKLLYDELYDSTWRQTRELSLLVRIREALASEMDLKSIIKTVVEATAESFDYGMVSVYLLKDSTLHLQHQAGNGHSLDEVPINKGIVGRVARTGQSAFLTDSRTDPDFLAADDNFSAEICVPILKNKVVVGVLNVETEQSQQLTSNDHEMMIALSEQIGSALERADLYSVIQESNQKYQMVVDNIREGIFQVDLAGNFTFLNKAWYALCGYTVEESIGQHFARFVAPSHVKELYKLQQSSPENDDIRLQTTLLRSDGTLVPIAAHLQRIYSPDGKNLGWGGTIMDISERLQAEQQAREMQLLVQVQEAISSQISLKDVIRHVVEATAKIFGYDLVCIYLLEGDFLHLQHQIGYDEVIETIPITTGVSGRVVRTKTAVLIEDPNSDADFLKAQDGITSEICVPLISNDQAMGFINVETKGDHKLALSDFNMLVRIGEQVSVAVERARLYTAVHTSNEKYQMVVDSVREIIFQTDLEGKISFLNKAWERITGRSIKESMGQYFVQFTPPDEVDNVRRRGLELAAGTDPYIFSNRQFSILIMYAYR